MAQNSGGIEAIQQQNEIKAKMIYDEIDRNAAFEGFAAKEDRSFMNATFNLAEGVDGTRFDEMWNAADISGLKGHRLWVGIALPFTMPSPSKVPKSSWRLCNNLKKRYKMNILANDGISQSGIEALEANGFNVITPMWPKNNSLIL